MGSTEDKGYWGTHVNGLLNLRGFIIHGVNYIIINSQQHE